MEYTILGNTIEIFYHKHMEGERFIGMHFDYSSRVFVTTHGITDILNYKDDEGLRIAQQMIFNDIIIKIKDASKLERLDYFQPLTINGTKCLLIDEGNHICFMASGEY